MDSLLDDGLLHRDTEVAPGLGGRPQHAVPHFQGGDRDGLPVFPDEPYRLGVLEDQARPPSVPLGLDEEEGPLLDFVLPTHASVTCPPAVTRATREEISISER